MKKGTGFSLIELMITVAIIGIISAIAYPSYVGYVAKSTRSDGLAALMRVANLQEQFYLDNRQFTEKMTDLGLPADPYISENRDYWIDSKGDTSFVISATAQGTQATRDSVCKVITISSEGAKAPAECWQ